MGLLLSTNFYFYIEAQMYTCVWNVFIPKTLNLKIQQSKLIENYSQILNPEYLCMLCTYCNFQIMSLVFYKCYIYWRMFRITFKIG